jgi:site-specific recombinase XerD
MPLRAKNGRWEYRFVISGQPRVTLLTDLEATEPNKKKAARLERDHRDRILKGLEQARKPKPALFSSAVEEFLKHCRVEHKDHPNTADRVKTSMASLLAMFGNRAVASIGTPDVERYKVWRLDGDRETKSVKTVTLRHDLDNFSKFFVWAIKMRMATSNPVNDVEKPSTEDAVRMYILSDAEEFLYFEMALARSMDLRDVTTLIVNQGMRPEEVIEIEKRNVDLVARTLRIPRGKTKAARRTLRLTSAVTA